MKIYLEFRARGSRWPKWIENINRPGRLNSSSLGMGQADHEENEHHNTTIGQRLDRDKIYTMIRTKIAIF